MLIQRGIIPVFDSIPPPAGPVDFVGNGTTDLKSDSDATQDFPHTRPITIQGVLITKVSSDVLVSTVTYGGNSLTKVREEGFGPTGCSYWVGLNTLPTGVNTTLVTYVSSTSEAVVRCDNLENVNQSTPTGNTNGQSGNLADSNLSVTISEDGLAMDIVTEDFFPISKTQGVSQNVLHNTNDGNVHSGSSNDTSQTAGSKTLGWTWSFSNDASHIIVEMING